MSLSEKLETGGLDSDMKRLEEAVASNLSKGQRIFGLANLLFNKSNNNLADIKRKSEKLADYFAGPEESSDSPATAKDRLKQELPHLDLKFSGGKKGARSNQELALEKIMSHLESLQEETDSLKKKHYEKYRQTPEGLAEAAREAEYRAECAREVLSSLSRPDDFEKISHLKISPRHLEIAGSYGVELTQEMILEEWKRMVSELLLHQKFAAQKERIKNFQKYKPFIDNFSDYNKKFEQIKDWVASLKGLRDQAVLALANIIAGSAEVMKRFHHYGISGASLNPAVRRMLTNYDDLSESQVYDSPAALAYEYVNHLLAASIGSGDARENAFDDFVKLCNFRYYSDSKCPGADAFGQKYSPEDFAFFDRQDYDPETLLCFCANWGRLISNLRDEIKAEGQNISPRGFIASFGQKNYDLIKRLPKLSVPEAKIADFPKEYVEPHGSWSQKYFEDESWYHQFEALVKQSAQKLEKLLPIRWLEEELDRKKRQNPEIWEILERKIKLAEYLKFLEKNHDYHRRRPIGIRVDADGKVTLLDNRGRQDEAGKKTEYRIIEESYKEHLKKEIAAIIFEIGRAENKIFSRKSELQALNDRLGTYQVLNSHSLADRIYGRISQASSQSFKESSLGSEELQDIDHFCKSGYQNLKRQQEIRERYEAVEKDLNRHPGKLDAGTLSEYPDLVRNISVYEQLISGLKLINTALSSLIREKHTSLIRNFSMKNKKYKELINDYNRIYHREGAYPLTPAIDSREDLAAYL